MFSGGRMKKCILGLRETCINCGECDNRCELDPSKICDNCFKCLETDKDYIDIPIDEIYMDEQEAEADMAREDLIYMLRQPDEELHEELDLDIDQSDATGHPDDE